MQVAWSASPESTGGLVPGPNPIATATFTGRFSNAMLNDVNFVERFRTKATGLFFGVVSQGHLSKIERRRIAPSIKIVFVLANKFPSVNWIPRGGGKCQGGSLAALRHWIELALPRHRVVRAAVRTFTLHQNASNPALVELSIIN